MSAAEDSSKKTIDNLIADLGSAQFDIREVATRALKERVDAIPALRKARRLADPEIRRRTGELLTVLEGKRAKQRLVKVKAVGEAGRAVEVADRLGLAAKYGIAGDEGWESLTQFADQIITRTNPQFPTGWKFYRIQDFPGGEFQRFTQLAKPKEIAERTVEIDKGGHNITPRDVKATAARKLIKETRGRLLLRGEKVLLIGSGYPAGLCCGMIASSGEVQIHGAICSVIVAGGDIKNAERLKDCVLICDGDVEFGNGWTVENVIVVARGGVRCKEGKLRNCLIRSGHTLRLPDGPHLSEKMIDLKDGTPNPVDFVKFFELTDVGIAAEDLPQRENSDAKGVRLKDVRKESPFSAGLRAGDVITAIEEELTPTTELFRRVLRRKLAEGGPLLTFTVRRSGTTLEVPLPVKD